MKLSRKDRAKAKYLNSKEGKSLWQSMLKRNLPISQVSDTALPDDFKFDGAKVVDGKFCRTAKEYKAALKKRYG